MKVLIQFTRDVEEVATMEVEISEAEVEEHFKDIGDDWAQRQPLDERLKLYVLDNERELLSANPIPREDIDVLIERHWSMDRVTRRREK